MLTTSIPLTTPGFNCVVGLPAGPRRNLAGTSSQLSLAALSPTRADTRSYDEITIRHSHWQACCMIYNTPDVWILLVSKHPETNTAKLWKSLRATFLFSSRPWPKVPFLASFHPPRTISPAQLLRTRRSRACALGRCYPGLRLGRSVLQVVKTVSDPGSVSIVPRRTIHHRHSSPR